MNYVYGPVPSRRLGLSLGISPIPKKTCNYSCIYCQLGRTDKMTNNRDNYFDVNAIIDEVRVTLEKQIEFDVITIVGEGEPTLFLGLDQLILGIKKVTSKPVAVITNGALLYDFSVQDALKLADIVLPSMDAYDDNSFKLINRPHKSIQYNQMIEGLISFSNLYKGQLWIEIMFINGVNDDDMSVQKFKNLLHSICYDRLYLNTPVRPPAENYVTCVDHQRMNIIAEQLNGLSIDLLESEGFFSNIEDDYEAIFSIIKRHPMNQFELKGFIQSRGHEDCSVLFKKMDSDARIDRIEYKGYITYRLK